MKLIDFVVELTQKGIRIEAQGKDLRVRGGSDVLTPELRAQLRERKQELLAFLGGEYDDDDMRLDWWGEARLDSQITPLSGEPARASDPQQLLFTGATGYVGAFVLREFLQRTTATIVCLVRGTSAGAAKERVIKNLKSFEIDVPSAWEERLIVRIGDISEPRFGWSDEEYEARAATVDTVYHGAAYVNWMVPYQSLWPSNVFGTAEVLRFATTGRNKRVHHVSTMGVFPFQADRPSVVMENDFNEDPEGLDLGYLHSKWVAEQMVREAQKRGIAATIYRPFFMIGDSVRGAWHSDEMLCRLMRAFQELGMYCSEYAGNTLSVTPVDYSASMIVRLALMPDTVGNNYHVIGPTQLGIFELSDRMQRAGFSLKSARYHSWRPALQERVERFKSPVLEPLLHFTETEPTFEGRGVNVEWDRSNAARLLNDGMFDGEVTGPLIEQGISFLTRTGFLAR